jgi:hypothetical protein
MLTLGFLAYSGTGFTILLLLFRWRFSSTGRPNYR